MNTTSGRIGRRPGTVIGKSTVLTAAHCLQGFEVEKMMFVLGDNYQYPYKPGGGPFAAASATYPDGSTEPFKFNPKTYEDDIGLLYLRDPIQAVNATLYGLAPTWDDILNKHQSLLFVGFGFNKIAGDLVGMGIKREGSWVIDTVNNRTIAFAVEGLNTCHGDSGGPAFVETPGALLLAAVTSTGDDACTHGVDTRVDAYSSWLAGKVR